MVCIHKQNTYPVAQSTLKNWLLIQADEVTNQMPTEDFPFVYNEIL